MRELGPDVEAVTLRDYMRGDWSWKIPVVTAGSLDAYLALAEQSQVAGEYVTLFRGQTRDYLDDRTGISFLPAAFRTRESASEWMLPRFSEEMQRGVTVWLDCLEEHGIVSRFVDPRASAQILRTPEILAVMKHYGFPTPSLDASADPLVALWFATHNAVCTANRWSHEPFVRPGPGSETTDLPSVYVFQQRIDEQDVPVVDLRGLEALRDVAERPFAQTAFGLPFEWIDHSFSDRIEGGLGLTSSTEYRYPSVLIKIDFGADELLARQPDLSARTLFPPDDPIYRALLESRAPQLAVYAES